MAGLAGAEHLAWLRLARSPGLGPRHVLRLIERFGTAVETVKALPRLLATEAWAACRLAELGLVERELDEAAATAATLLAQADPRYPEALRAIPDPPVMLTLRGDPGLLALEGVALVGARNASANGRVIAQTMAGDLAQAGLVVVSGLARGIDTAAHRGALDQGGATVAVVAGGADVVYPAENAALTEEIARRGLVVSERPLGAVPRAQDFPRRNRLIAGLSLGVVVVEAAPASGSLITAKLAAEQGREVMAVPGSPLDPRHRGTNQLLRDGATLVEDAADVLAAVAALRRQGPPPARRAPASPPEPAAEPVAARPASPRRSAAPAGRSQARQPGETVAMAKEDLPQRLRRALGPDPVAVDALSRQCALPMAQLQAALVELELQGAILRHPGNRVSRKPG